MKYFLYAIASLIVAGAFGIVFILCWRFSALDALSILAIAFFAGLGAGLPIYIWVDEKTRSRKHKSW